MPFYHYAQISFSTEIRNAGSKNLPINAGIAQYVEFPFEADIRNIASNNLPFNAVVRNASSVDFSFSSGIAQIANLSYSAVIRQPGSLPLPINATIRNASSVDFRFSSLVRNAGSKALSHRAVIRHTASKTSRITAVIRHPGSKDMRITSKISRIVYPADLGLGHEAYVQKTELIVDMPYAFAVNLASKDTEYSLKLPLGTKKVWVQEKGASVIRLSWEPGHVAASIDPFIPIGTLPYEEDDLHLLPRTIYLASPADSRVVQVLVWI